MTQKSICHNQHQLMLSWTHAAFSKKARFPKILKVILSLHQWWAVTVYSCFMWKRINHVLMITVGLNELASIWCSGSRVTARIRMCGLCFVWIISYTHWKSRWFVPLQVELLLELERATPRNVLRRIWAPYCVEYPNRKRTWRQKVDYKKGQIKLSKCYINTTVYVIQSVSANCVKYRWNNRNI